MLITFLSWIYLGPLIISLVLAILGFGLKPADKNYWIDSATLSLVPILNWVVAGNLIYAFWENL